MKLNESKMKVGDSVRVKPGVIDSDTSDDIGGWQGRISEVEDGDDETMITIVWDSITLKNMPRSFIEYSEREGLDWQGYQLASRDVEPASARDSERDVDNAVDEIERHSSWLHLDEEGKRIQEVLDGIDPDDETAIVEAWEKRLEEKLSFPFEAEVVELLRQGPLQIGDRVKVKSIVLADDLYGIIVRVNRGKESFDFPLCDLEATDQNSTNYQIVKDYVIWYANR